MANGPDAHELTVDEVRERFLAHVADLVEYWSSDHVPGDVRSRVDGVAFSLLVALDGGAMALPGFLVAPSPHPDDKEFSRSQGEDWYPDNDPEQVNADIAGTLHEEYARRFSPMRRRAGES